MARRDIQFHTATEGGADMAAYPLAASQSVAEGEPIVLASGTLSEAADDPAAIHGISAVPTTEGLLSTTVRPTGTLIQVYTTARRQLFRSKNFATDGAGTSATPTVANAVGKLAGFSLTNGTWSVDTGTANLLVHIESVLTADGRQLGPPSTTGLTGTTVVFRFI